MTLTPLLPPAAVARRRQPRPPSGAGAGARRPLAVLLGAMCLLLWGTMAAAGRGTPAAAAGAPPAAAGSPPGARSAHSATLLASGKVLVAGGATNAGTGPPSPLATAALYDPATGAWSATGTLAQGRFGHTATLLDDGRVLVAGGTVAVPGGGLAATSSAELYDPGSGTWRSAGHMAGPRAGHTATLLPATGRVLVAGGGETCGAGDHPGAGEGPGALASVEAFDAARGWHQVRRLATGRALHTASLLPDGQVLMVGGTTGCSGAAGAGPAPDEVYDPAAKPGSAAVGVGRSAVARRGHAATTLADGSVLVTGGVPAAGGPPLAGTEIFDPGTAQWRAAQDLDGGREAHTATLLPDGSVLVLGGAGQTAPTALLAGTAGLGAGAGGWSATTPLEVARAQHTATVLATQPCGGACGKVLVVGGTAAAGSGRPGDTEAEELYTPRLRIDGVVPDAAPAGTEVTVTGAGFTGDSAVRFGGVPAPSVRWVSGVELRAVVPVPAAGPADVALTVSTPAGSSDLAAPFHYREADAATTGAGAVAPESPPPGPGFGGGGFAGPGLTGGGFVPPGPPGPAGAGPAGAGPAGAGFAAAGFAGGFPLPGSGDDPFGAGRSARLEGVGSEPGRGLLRWP